jgi:hypothetical protein
MTMTDEVIDASISRAPPSSLATVLAWAGGVLHARQAQRAVTVLGNGQPGDGSDVIRFESLIRLADPASPRLAEKVRIVTSKQRHQLAEIMLDTAVSIGTDPRAGLVEKVAAWQAAHRVRGDLPNRTQLAGVQCQLVHGLEDLGDSAAAYQVAETALAESLAIGLSKQRAPEHDDLSAAVLRLARIRASGHHDPLVDATVAAVAAGGPAVGLEARIWAAIDLLDQPGQRERALKLTDQITTELTHRNDLGAIGKRWRLLMAFHAGRAGYPRISQELLSPMLAAPDPSEDGDVARAVLYAVGGPRADTRLQIIGLEAELATLPSNADDDRLRVHHALAADYNELGDYRRARHHGQQELLMRNHIQGPDHPDTLTTRHNVAIWTGRSGYPAEAVRLLSELLPDQERIAGHDHPDTLSTRMNRATSIGQSGHPAEALRLLTELLPDIKRVLGHDHRTTLYTRKDIAGWTGESGHPAEAVRLLSELLPDIQRVLGHDHVYTLTARNNLAYWADRSGDPAEALRLLTELLPDTQRVLGHDHPGTLLARSNIAESIRLSGNPAEALRLFQELLPDARRILGADHFDTLIIHSRYAFSTGESGNPTEASRLFQKLLPDQERILGHDHPKP